MNGERRATAFHQLVGEVQGCHLCPRMAGRAHVLSHRNGDIASRVLVIAEAPGRLGAEESSIPLYGDQTGRNFERLLHAAGLSREHIFITNAVLCNPRGTSGNNAPPSAQEVRNCSPHLHRTVDVLQPCYIVTLGTSALRALHLIAPHDVILRRDIGKVIPWNGHLLIPLYHPGSRACIHRPLTLQEEDYRRLGALLRSAGAATLLES
ncbi:MAG TPA: uracil-DNA glycosylase [Ktedonobacterales bacterium]